MTHRKVERDVQGTNSPPRLGSLYVVWTAGRAEVWVSLEERALIEPRDWTWRVRFLAVRSQELTVFILTRSVHRREVRVW